MRSARASPASDPAAVRESAGAPEAGSNVRCCVKQKPALAARSIGSIQVTNNGLTSIFGVHCTVQTMTVHGAFSPCGCSMRASVASKRKFTITVYRNLFI